MAETQTKEKVIFYSINRKFKLGADSIRREERFSNGDFKRAGHIIEFYEGIYSTDNKREIAIIKNSNEYKTSRVRMINEKDQQTLLKVRAMKFLADRDKEDNPSQETGYVDKNDTGVAEKPKQEFENPVI